MATDNFVVDDEWLVLADQRRPTSANWIRQHGEGNVLQRTIGDDHQMFVTKLSCDRREHCLTKRSSGGGQIGFGLGDAFLTLQIGLAVFARAARRLCTNEAR